jgi:hypothetical protein
MSALEVLQLLTNKSKIGHKFGKLWGNLSTFGESGRCPEGVLGLLRLHFRVVIGEVQTSTQDAHHISQA